jgi:type II secretory pathway pseudopilin PulG
MRTNANTTVFRRAPSGTSLRAFTIVELLVVIGVIIVLLSLIVVAVTAGTRAAQRTNTVGLMNAIKTALAQFETDIGYLPPVLAPHEGDNPQQDSGTMRNLRMPPDPLPRNADLSQRQEFQNWFSYTTIADYLIGYGPVRLDNDDKPWSPDGHGGFGIRSPGSDGYWGANTSRPGALPNNLGTFGWREEFLNPDSTWRDHSAQYRQGQVYGPYLELRDERLVAGLHVESGGTIRAVFPGEPEYTDELPKTVVDYWGEPIRYYRLPYDGQPGRAYRPRPHDPAFRVPNVSDFFVLRPYEVRSGQDTDGLPDSVGDTTTTYRLQGARFGLFSTGPDRRAENRVRFDDRQDPYDNQFNRDNIVEVGP